MNRLFAAVILSVALGIFPALAQEKRDMPMKGQMPTKEGTPIKGEGMQAGGMDMSKMKEMHGRMSEMKKGMGGMMGDMSGMMGNMGQMTGSGKMSPEEMAEMSKMMGDMSGMMKQMSERMNRAVKKPN